jgi:general secretion pathway protein D
VTIGTRNITSVIRLKSGETSLLAGLIRRDKTKGVVKTPLLGDIPWLGRLFRNETVQNKDTDLVLTLTPQIIRFPDIEEEDLAPVWVGTESRISFSGTRPRVQSGRAPRGPFDERGGAKSDHGGSDAGERPYGTPASRRPTAPRRVEPSSDAAQGVELVPSGSPKSGEDVGWSDVPEFVEPEALDESKPPLLLGLEPSVLSVRPSDQAVVQLVVRGGSGSYRLPVGLSFDPTRVAIESITPGPGVEILRHEFDDEAGWIDFDLIVTDGSELGQPVASLNLLALGAGPVPLVLSSTEAVTGDGARVPVASSDGALYVTNSGLVDRSP